MNNCFSFPSWHANSLTFTHYADFKEEAVSMSENQQMITLEWSSL